MISNHHQSNTNSKRGAALLLVLWIIGLVSMIVVSFVWDAHLEGKVVSFSRKRLKADALANSGMKVATMLLTRSAKVTGNETEEETEGDKWYEPSLKLSRGESVTIEVPLGEGSVRIDIEPEDVWRNVNKLTQEDWERMFLYIGLPEDYWEELIACFYDWTDEDSNVRQDGAETDDYYAELDPPYRAANADLQNVRELLLIKGFSEPILTGGVLNPEDPPASQIILTNGIERLLSTFGDGKVNVNAIGPNDIGVLYTLPGVDDLAAGAILDPKGSFEGDPEEEDYTYKSVQDFMNRVGDYLEDDTIRNFITTSSKYYKITSVGQIDRVTRRIWADVYTDGKLIRFLRHREEP